MNITEIQICSPVTDTFRYTHARLALRNPNMEQPFILKASTGLDADEILSVYNGSPVGPKYFKMGPKKRTVVLLIKTNPQYGSYLGFDTQPLNTAGDLRDVLYKAISWGNEGELELRFMTDSDYTASLFGFVTKVEASTFSPETEMQLTIECDYPFLRSTEDVYPVTELGLVYAGLDDFFSTAPHGWKCQFKFTEDCNSFSMHEVNQKLKKALNYSFHINYAFKTNDLLHFSSEDEDKYLFVEKGSPTSVLRGYKPNMSKVTHLTDKIQINSVWPLMRPGKNSFKLSRESTGIILYNLTYRPTYWGI